MSTKDKTGLGYGTQLNEMSNNSKTGSEISLSVFDVRSSDEENTLANDSLSKVDGFHTVPPPITGNFLTSRADISFVGLDEYAIRMKIIESKTTDLNTKRSETKGKTNPLQAKDRNLWDIIVNGDLQEESAPTGAQSGPPAPLVPKTVKQLAAKKNQERVKSILLLAIPDEYLLKFHNVLDAKSLWEAIKSRFRGNEESKKMQKNVHGAPILKEEINQKFLRSHPPLWNQIALIMRNKPDIDEIDIDDLYNNLRVYEDEMKRSSSSTSTSQNLAFLSSENTSSTNEVSTTSGDFGIDEDDLEELDLRWQCYNYHRKAHFARECRSGRNQGKRSYGDTGRSNAPT
ncbi:hypothetical protein Tco_1083457, partial [Tanacetum coccineum]